MKYAEDPTLIEIDSTGSPKLLIKLHSGNFK